MKKIILSLLLPLFLVQLLYANSEPKLYFHDSSVANAHTALLFLQSSNIHDAKLSFEELNIDFVTHPTQKNSYFALIPIKYELLPNRYNVIVSYFHNNQKIFKSIALNVVDGNYKSEVLQVQQSKVTLNEKDKKRTDEEYAQAMEVYNTISPFSVTSFVPPLNSMITSHFGNKRVYNNQLQSFHSGTDFKASVGTPLHASAQGIVKISKDRFYAGNSVVIDHGNGIYSCYFHMDSMLVKEGQRVQQNELLGYSGNTGRVTGPHLHFTIRVRNVIVDPLQFIKTINLLN